MTEALPSAPVCLILPTHDHAATLEFSLNSVLGQSFPDFAVIVIGDGVHDDTRDVMSDICARDSRVVFLDRPKAPGHGEQLRDEVIRSVESGIIAYHGDDDLLLPHHLEHMVAVLDGHDFAHPLPVAVLEQGTLYCVGPTDLSRRECLDWHLGRTPRNAVSMTGVVHTRDSYLRLPYGWRPAPPGRWSDHYMWEQYFALPGFDAVTSRRATTIKLTAALRQGASASERAVEISWWWSEMSKPDFPHQWDSLVFEAVFHAAVTATVDKAALTDSRTEPS